MKLPDIERVAAAVHDVRVAQYRAQGEVSRLAPTGEDQLAPYAHLTEASKELDRATVRAVYAAIERARKEDE